MFLSVSTCTKIQLKEYSAVLSSLAWGMSATIMFLISATQCRAAECGLLMRVEFERLTYPREAVLRALALSGTT